MSSGKSSRSSQYKEQINLLQQELQELKCMLQQKESTQHQVSQVGAIKGGKRQKSKKQVHKKQKRQTNFQKLNYANSFVNSVNSKQGMKISCEVYQNSESDGINTKTKSQCQQQSQFKNSLQKNFKFKNLKVQGTFFGATSEHSQSTNKQSILGSTQNQKAAIPSKQQLQTTSIGQKSANLSQSVQKQPKNNKPTHTQYFQEKYTNSKQIVSQELKNRNYCSDCKYQNSPKSENIVGNKPSTTKSAFSNNYKAQKYKCHQKAQLKLYKSKSCPSLYSLVEQQQFQLQSECNFSKSAEIAKSCFSKYNQKNNIVNQFEVNSTQAIKNNTTLLLKNFQNSDKAKFKQKQTQVQQAKKQTVLPQLQIKNNVIQSQQNNINNFQTSKLFWQKLNLKQNVVKQSNKVDQQIYQDMLYAKELQNIYDGNKGNVQINADIALESITKQQASSELQNYTLENTINCLDELINLEYKPQNNIVQTFDQEYLQNLFSKSKNTNPWVQVQKKNKISVQSKFQQIQKVQNLHSVNSKRHYGKNFRNSRQLKEILPSDKKQVSVTVNKSTAPLVTVNKSTGQDVDIESTKDLSRSFLNQQSLNQKSNKQIELQHNSKNISKIHLKSPRQATTYTQLPDLNKVTTNKKIQQRKNKSLNQLKNKINKRQNSLKANYKIQTKSKTNTTPQTIQKASIYQTQELNSNIKNIAKSKQRKFKFAQTRKAIYFCKQHAKYNLAYQEVLQRKLKIYKLKGSKKQAEYKYKCKKYTQAKQNLSLSQQNFKLKSLNTVNQNKSKHKQILKSNSVKQTLLEKYLQDSILLTNMQSNDNKFDIKFYTPSDTISTQSILKNKLQPIPIVEGYEEQSISTSSHELQNQMQQYLDAQQRQTAQKTGMQAVFDELSKQNRNFAEYIQRILEQNTTDIKDFQNIIKFLNSENQQYIQNLTKQQRNTLENSVNQYIEIYQQLNRYEVSLQEQEHNRHAQYTEFFKQIFENRSEVAKLNHSVGIQKNKQYEISDQLTNTELKINKLKDEIQNSDLQNNVIKQYKDDIQIVQNQQNTIQKQYKDLLHKTTQTIEYRLTNIEKSLDQINDLSSDIKDINYKQDNLNNSNIEYKESLRIQKEQFRKLQQNDVKVLQNQYLQLSNEYQEIKGDQNELSSQIEDQQQQLNKLTTTQQQQLINLKQVMKNDQNQFRQEQLKLDSKLQNFQQQINRQVQNITDNTNLSTIQSMINDSVSQLVKQDVEFVQQEMTNQKQDIQSIIKSEQSKIDEKIRKLQQTTQSITTKDQNTKFDINKLQTQVDTLTQKQTANKNVREEVGSSKNFTKNEKKKVQKFQHHLNSSSSSSTNSMSSETSSVLSESSSELNSKIHKSKKRHKQSIKTQRILGEFKFEKYTGQSDPKIWFKGFENKAILYNLFDKENKKLLINELYFLMMDKAREYFEDKKLLKRSYRSIKKILLKKFAKDTYKANYKITQIRMKDNESISEFFDKLKRFAKQQGVRDDLVRDTFLNNLHVQGITNYIESLQLRIESDSEFSSYDAKEKVIHYIEKHRLNDKSKRFIHNKETKPFEKNNNKGFKHKKDFKGKKVTGIELDNENKEEDEFIEPNYENEDELLYEQSQDQYLTNNQGIDKSQSIDDHETEIKDINTITIQPKQQLQLQTNKELSNTEITQLYNMEKKHVKNQRNLFDTLGKMVQENRKIPLFDISKYNRYNMIHQPWIQVINESPKQMLNHIEQISTIIENQDNFFNQEQIILKVKELQKLMLNKYTTQYVRTDFKTSNDQVEPDNIEVNAMEIVNAKESEQLQYIPIIVDDKQCIAMVDSGSQISAISKKYLLTNNQLLSQVEDTKEVICTGNGQKESVTQKVRDVVINLANKVKVRVNIYVTLSETYDFLIGRNVLDVINGIITSNGLKFLNKQFIPQIQVKQTNFITCNTLSQIKHTNSKAMLKNFPKQKYDLIYADLPYQYGMTNHSITPTYEQLTDQQLLNLPIQDIAKDNSILLLWVTSSKLDIAMQSIKRYGFKFRTKIIEWIKLDKNNNIIINPGKYSTNSTESLLLATKGNINNLLKETIIKQVMFEYRQGHSVKPWSTYIKLEQKFNLNKMKCIELFARQQAPSPFDSYGNELPNNFIAQNSSQIQIKDIKVKQQQDQKKFFFENNALSKEIIDTRVRQILERIPQPQNRTLLQDLIIKFIDIFAFKKDEIGKTPLMQHKIKIRPGTLPIQKKPYNLSPAEKQWLNKELQSLLDMGFIEKCMPSWALPIILARKNNNDFRMCIDFRPLNKAIIPEIYPIMRVSEIFPMLSGKKYFSKLDGKSAYWHLEICEEDRDYTGFICIFGCFRWVRMPFGLKNAPYYFQKLMEQILGPYLRKFCMVYLDDIVVFSNSKQEHIQHLELIFQALRDSDLRLGFDKCDLFTTELELLGHKIRGTAIEPLGKRIEAIQKMQIPINRTQLRSFLGLCNYYRNYIDRFAQIAKPLYDLTQQNTNYKWEIQHQKAFSQLRELLSTKPILSLPNEEDIFILSTDFSENGLGAILSQRNEEGKEVVIEYASRTLRGAERNYIAYEGEILALHWALDKFRHYLQGRKFEVYTDNKSLQTVLDKSSPSKKIIRWLIDLVDYDFIPMHRIGNKNPADALSRLPIKNQIISKHQYLQEQPSNIALQRLKELSLQAEKEGYNQVNSTQGLPQILTFPDIGDIQCTTCTKTNSTNANPILLCDKCGIGQHLKCQGLNTLPNSFWYCNHCKQAIKSQDNFQLDITQDFNVLQYLQEPTFKVTNTQEQSRIERRAERYTWHNNRLWCFTSEGEKLVPSVAERQLILIERHDLQGHGGIEQLINLISNDLYWPSMRLDIQNFVKNCDQCKKLRPTFVPHSKYYPTDKGNTPFYTVAIDLATNLPKTSSNNIHLILAVDTFSKWVELYPINNKKSKGIAEWFFNHIVARHGCPRFIRTDRGKEFFGDLIKLLDLFNIPIIRISTGYPQSNGQAEKYVDTVKKMMMRFVENKTQTMEWDQALPTIAMTLRATSQSSTQLSPFEILYGRKMNLPTSCIIKNQELKQDPTDQEIKDYVHLLQQEIKRIHVNVTKNLKRTDEYRTKRYSNRLQDRQQKRKRTELVQGNELYVQRMRKTSLESPTAGPYIFIKYSDNRKVSCQVKNPITNRVITVSVSNVIPSSNFREELEQHLTN